MLNRLHNRHHRLVRSGGRWVGYRQSQDRIVHDAQAYWRDTNDRGFKSNSHWRGEGALDEQTWRALGKIHLDLFENLSRLTTLQKPLQRVVEWGCGGGANAVHFAPVCNQFVGVDVSQASLDECARNVRDATPTPFVPVLIDVDDPEAGVAKMPGLCDLFLCTYVFELLPTPEYGRRLLDIAKRVLQPRGVALIQIKYTTLDPGTRPRRWGYRSNLANMTSYPIDTFWELATDAGFVPKAVTLQPRQPLVNDERYAYFLLENSSHGA